MKAYLEAIESAEPKRRGRKRTPESIGRRLETIAARLPDARVLTRLGLLQERRDLPAQLAAMEASSEGDPDRLRGAFVKVAKGYSERTGIRYRTWREAGVDAATLREAGITRSGA